LLFFSFFLFSAAACWLCPSLYFFIFFAFLRRTAALVVPTGTDMRPLPSFVSCLAGGCFSFEPTLSCTPLSSPAPFFFQYFLGVSPFCLSATALFNPPCLSFPPGLSFPFLNIPLLLPPVSSFRHSPGRFRPPVPCFFCPHQGRFYFLPFPLRFSFPFFSCGRRFQSFIPLPSFAK